MLGFTTAVYRGLMCNFAKYSRKDRTCACTWSTCVQKKEAHMWKWKEKKWKSRQVSPTQHTQLPSIIIPTLEPTTTVDYQQSIQYRTKRSLVGERGCQALCPPVFESRSARVLTNLLGFAHARSVRKRIPALREILVPPYNSQRVTGTLSLSLASVLSQKKTQYTWNKLAA